MVTTAKLRRERDCLHPPFISDSVVLYLRNKGKPGQFGRKERDLLPVNDGIRAREVMLIEEDGGQNHVISTAEALSRAAAAELDLVLVAPHANPPVARIMDFGKYRYEQDRAARKQKQTRKAQELKEIRLTARMEGHDLEQRVKRAQEFIEDGHRLHLSVRFRGRENLFRERGINLMKRFAEDVGQQFETPPRVAGNTVSVNLIPKTKTDVPD